MQRRCKLGFHSDFLRKGCTRMRSKLPSLFYGTSSCQWCSVVPSTLRDRRQASWHFLGGLDVQLNLINRDSVRSLEPAVPKLQRKTAVGCNNAYDRTRAFKPRSSLRTHRCLTSKALIPPASDFGGEQKPEPSPVYRIFHWQSAGPLALALTLRRRLPVHGRPASRRT